MNFSHRNRKCIQPRPNGASCGCSSDCKSGNCCGVWPFKRCRECCKNSHCDGNQICVNRKCSDCFSLGESCGKDSHCCGSTKCCGKALFGAVKGQCILATDPCCIFSGQQCNPSPLAPVKCCSGQCRELFPGSNSFQCF